MISRTGNEICCDKNQICALRFFWDFICVIPHSCNRIFGCLILDGDFYHLIDPQGKKKIEFCLQCYICRYFYSQMFIQAENFYSAKSFNVGGLLLLLVSALFVPAACTAICKMTEIWYEGIDGIRVFYYFLCINLKLQKFLLC